MKSTLSSEPLRLTKVQARSARIVEDASHGWALEFSHRGAGEGFRWNSGTRFRYESPFARLVGPDARRAAALLLPHVSPFAGSSRTVQHAVTLVEQTGDPASMFVRVVHNTDWKSFALGIGKAEPRSLAALPAPLRLALEMAAHEESERRALEGELAELERAWKDAEEIAAIADRL